MVPCPILACLLTVTFLFVFVALSVCLMPMTHLFSFACPCVFQLRNCVAAVDKDATKFFEANNKAAGTRARKHLQQLKTLAQVRRSISVLSVSVNDGGGCKRLGQVGLVFLLGFWCIVC